MNPLYSYALSNASSDPHLVRITVVRSNQVVSLRFIFLSHVRMRSHAQCDTDLPIRTSRFSRLL